MCAHRVCWADARNCDGYGCSQYTETTRLLWLLGYSPPTQTTFYPSCLSWRRTGTARTSLTGGSKMRTIARATGKTAPPPRADARCHWSRWTLVVNMFKAVAPATPPCNSPQLAPPALLSRRTQQNSVFPLDSLLRLESFLTLMG